MRIRYCLIVTTYSKARTGSNIIDALLAERLAACIQVVPITSFYTWKGRRARSRESLLLIKARARDFGLVESAILRNHDYEIPEIVSLPVDRGFAAYLGWMAKATAHGRAQASR